jgi:hypothetical protein
MLNHRQDQVPAVLVEWVVAERAGDAGGISDRLTEDFVAVGPLGFLLSKREWLDRHATGALTYDAFEIEEPQVRMYGAETVLVICRLSQRGTYRGNPVPTDTRASVLLVGDGASRRIAEIHMSFIAGTPGAPPIPGPPPGTVTR